MAGHSKWANIKHRKGRQDAARGKLFAKLAKGIEAAARAGGGDPSMNAALNTAVAKADRKSTRLNSSHVRTSRMPSSA